MKKTLNAFSAIALLGSLAAAPALAGVSVEKLTLTPAANAKVGDKVVAQIDFSGDNDSICGIEVEFGDGTRQTFKIKSETKLPIVVEHVYKAPAEYKVRAAGNRVENALSCAGKQIVMYKVAAAPAAAAAATPASACPADWALKGKAAKDGSFTCVPKKGVKAPKKPEQPIACPAGTSYFTKGKTLGCEKS
ncbi:MAG: hypothetical protein ACM3SV_02910 [Betaproteobacteria bacterium]